MKCPHCLEGFHAESYKTRLDWPERPGFASRTHLSDADGKWSVIATICPECRRCSLYLVCESENAEPIATMIRPKGISRSPLPAEVSDEYSADYKEACLVLTDSPKSSAALSRRCLQHLLREKVAVKQSDLANEIQEVLDSHKLPSDLADDLDAIRRIGNFATHPIKSASTGEIVDVEPGEAEWNLNVLEELFDFYFVRPERAKARRDALNAKLADAKKPPLKKGAP